MPKHNRIEQMVLEMETGIITGLKVSRSYCLFGRCSAAGSHHSEI